MTELETEVEKKWVFTVPVCYINCNYITIVSDAKGRFTYMEEYKTFKEARKAHEEIVEDLYENPKLYRC